VTLWPQFDVLFANPARLASLTPQQRGWLQQAAADAARNSVTLVAGQNSPYIGQACAMGARFATATPADLAALRRAFTPVYRSLEADPQTSAFIAQIQQLKKATPPGLAPAIPAGCAARQ
jgi:TRAP-type C4-dicarboxylate transport system substrate-binding protein